MKVKGPNTPLTGAAETPEPFDPRELRKAVAGERFAAALSQLEAQTETGAAGGAQSATRAALAEIANGADLLSGEGAAAAVREAARYMITARLNEKYREQQAGRRLVEELGAYVAAEPLLKAKLLAILQKVRTG